LVYIHRLGPSSRWQAISEHPHSRHVIP
jgi:hypothetical protein